MNVDQAMKEIRAHEDGRRDYQAAVEQREVVRNLRRRFKVVEEDLKNAEEDLVKLWERATPYVARDLPDSGEA